MINPNYFLLNVAALTVGTICIRGFFIALSGKMNISPKVKELFTYIPAAIFPALIIPATFFHPNKERFIILIVSGIACYFVRNTLFVICFGLSLLYLIAN